MEYGTLKLIHVGCVGLTLALFLGRGVLSFAGSPLLRARWLRVAPHAIDTVLLLSALMLAYKLGQYPGTSAWLSAKVAGLLVYIGLGMVALRQGRSLRIRAAAWTGALLVFAYIAAVAATRNPAPWTA